MSDLKKVLVIGQTPPPYGGQAVMIEQLLNCSFSSVEFFHVRMAFSEDMDSIGRFRFRKVVHLFEVIFKIYAIWMRKRPDVLYYPPAGPDKIPFFRDAAILIACRWLFRRTVFHFHASGISILYNELGSISRYLFRLAYTKPDVAIRTSSLNPDDGVALKARSSIVIENGLPVEYLPYQEIMNKRKSHEIPIILYVGALYESKGISVLIEACKLLRQSGEVFHLNCVGRFESADYESEIRRKIESEHIADYISFPGVLSGREKWKAYATADIFCFPSFFESESFGLVNIEAMQFGLPVVSTDWRGIPSVIDEGKSGFLVEIKNAQQVAERLSLLIGNMDLRELLGKRGREIFIERYSEEIWRKKMDRIFSALDV